MEINLIIIGTLIFIISAMLQGLTGFGFSILAVPLITLFISPKVAVPILLLNSMIINIIVLHSTWKSLELKRILILLLFGIIGMPLGAHLLVVLDENILKILIGSFIFIFGLLLIFGFRKQFKREKLSMIPIGITSGFLGGSISMSGPPIILFLANMGVGKHTFRGNLAAYFFLLNIFTIPVYIMNGLITKQVLSYSVTFLPGLLIGVISGNILSHRIKEKHFRKLILFLLLIMGILSIISGMKSIL
ncbi:MAG: sulfite exporter TauE/SafE family protein [Candidatus Cloacimonetes bacterium]|nr:sulfite exporter TauE/SafE family protein [Candidatus Cloacimonadota bacterium]